MTRLPYGNVNDAAKEVIHTPLIRWSVDPLDWQSKDPDSILGITLDQIHDGAIILMHDIYPTSVEAAGNIIDSLRSSGYEFATVSELARFRNVTLSDGVEYYNFAP